MCIYSSGTSGAPLHTLSTLYDVPVGFASPSFEPMYCYICGRRRLAVAGYRMICLVLSDIGFMAYPSYNMSTNRGTKLWFDRVDRNDGGGYNVSNGIFTVPVAGVYHFFWNLDFYRGIYVIIAFMLNETKKVYSFATKMDYDQLSCSIYLRLKMGDRVYLEADSVGGYIRSERFSVFGGELIRH